MRTTGAPPRPAPDRGGAGHPAEVPGAAAPPRPDASMSLLREAAERSLDPGYAIAAHARSATTAAPSRRRAASSGVLALALGVVLTASIAHLRQPSPPQDREALVRRIEARAADASAARARIETLRTEVETRQARALGAAGSDLVEDTERLGALAATAAVTGPGLRVVLDDAPGAREDAIGGDPRSPAGTSAATVLDTDLQMVANGLFAAGAEAVAIDGQRLTSLAAIRVAGQAILVGYQPLAPPYVVEAVGDPSSMASTFAASPAGDALSVLGSEFGIQVTSTAHDRLAVPGGSTEVLRHARAAAGSGS